VTTGIKCLLELPVYKYVKEHSIRYQKSTRLRTPDNSINARNVGSHKRFRNEKPFSPQMKSKSFSILGSDMLFTHTNKVIQAASPNNVFIYTLLISHNKAKT
jgi:hypothetical protein